MVPTLGESVTEATVAKWFKSPGDPVAKDEPLVELETDKVTLQDLRLFLGWESVRSGGGGKFVEVGYVFDRGIEYKNNEEEYEFSDAVVLRGGVRF